MHAIASFFAVLFALFCGLAVLALAFWILRYPILIAYCLLTK